MSGMNFQTRSGSRKADCENGLLPEGLSCAREENAARDSLPQAQYPSGADTFLWTIISDSQNFFEDFVKTC